MASNDNPNPDFDDLHLPTEQFEAGPVDGMPDPTAQSDEPLSTEEPLEQPTGEEGEPAAASPERLGLVAKITQANLFTVLLAISLTAILVAIFCLIMQLASYGFDYKAKSASRQAASAMLASPFSDFEGACSRKREHATRRFIEPVQAELV